MVRRVTVAEKGETLVDLTLDQAIELQNRRICRVLPTNVGGRWRVTDVVRVGVVVLTDITIIVEPKTPVQSIVYMASLGQMQLAITADEIQHGAEHFLPAALADALISSVETATKRGLIKGYRTVQESASVVRGHWDVARQLARRPGLPLPIEIEYDDFAEDITENQILHTALRSLRDLPGLTSATKRRLTRLLVLFADVERLPRGLPLPAVINTRLNQHYARALQLAQVILDAVAWTHRDGTFRGGSFLVNMALVFERFVAHTLRAELYQHGFGLVMQDQQWWLDTGQQVTLRPDIVITRASSPVTVADTKYKVLTDAASSPPNGDVYQALAYALALGVSDAHLLYAAGDADPRVFNIPGVGVSIHVHAIELDGDAITLDARVRALAASLVRLSV